MIYRTLKEGNLFSQTCERPDFHLICDVFVVGMGTAGAIAALCAAELGVRVIGIDYAQAPGGIAVSAGVQNYYFGAPGGRWERIHADCLAASADFIPSNEAASQRTIDTAAAKSHALERALEAAGVTAYYESILLGVYLEGDAVCGVRFFDGQRTYDAQAQIVIDGADGFAARLAGASFQSKRQSDGISMPATVFQLEYRNGTLANVWDRSRMVDHLDVPALSRQLLSMYASPVYLKEDASQAPIAEVGSLLGRRELFCVHSEEDMSLARFFQGERTASPAFFAFSCTDNSAHDPAAEDTALADWMFLAGICGHGFSIPVPYRAMIPKGVRHLLVTGKCIGTGHEMLSCVRMKSDMEKCGEAAGVLAALAVQGACDVRDVPYTLLADHLQRSGCLDAQWDVGVCDLRIPTERLWQPVRLPETKEELAQAFASDHPEEGLAQAVFRTVSDETFSALLSHKDERVRDNAAIALGIRGRQSVLPHLYLMAQRAPVWQVSHTTPKAFAFPWLRTTVHCNYLKAVMLLGRFGYRPFCEFFKRDLARIEELLPKEVPHAPTRAEAKTIFERFLRYNIEKLAL